MKPNLSSKIRLKRGIQLFSGLRLLITLISAAVLLTVMSGQAQAKEEVVYESSKAKNALSHTSANPLIRNPYKNVVGRTAIQQFYESRMGDLFWHSSRGTLTSDAKSFIKTIKQSWQHGVNPQKLRLADVDSLLSDERSPEQKTALDITLTDAFIRYVRDLSGMRVSAPAVLLNKRDWLQPYPVADILTYLPRVTRFDNLGDQIVPESKTYKRLQKELVRLYDNPEQLKPNYYNLNFGSKVLRPGQSHRNVPAIRERLSVDAQTSDQALYDDRLAGAVMKFQRDHGLKPDGIIGSQTRYILNQGPYEDYLKIIANLERLRWKPDPGHDRFVIVNIPSATLWAMNNGKVAFEMPVVVGRKKRETQSFITHITGIRINPDWTLPPTIKTDDIAPAMIKDPEYLKNKGITVYSGYGKGAEKLDEQTLNWAEMTENEIKSLRMVQPPSRRNPLGLYRVLMPNKYNIYLHDTNNKGVFERAVRGVSSGCIRMSEPHKLAEYILENSKWPADKLEETLAKGKKRDLMISDKIPVYILYNTVWVDYQGKVVYGHDLYGWDKTLIDELKRLDAFVVPSHNK